MRHWLDVPYGEKDTARAAGARWDGTTRRWYAPQSGMAALARWEPRPVLPDVLPGEDRAFGAGLYVDLIPQSCWFTNVRTAVDAADWNRIRTMVYDRARHRCETCGDRMPPRAGRLDAHERWDYQSGRVQRLTRLLAVCKPCHLATHYGFAEMRGRGNEARRHLAAVNWWTTAEVDAHIAAAFETWQERSRHVWTLDLSILTRAGVTPMSPHR